ncbi:MAG: Rpn family recombination-promoting nuclease/putative transposase [Leptospiraceae bacterium]|nr:Rpn family recombination-promoting nuclease/putative transposase [Leptospiraceae bacterium]MCP5502544.1 Rpn family recombination-promoting nuclease/putative transposase [Leptospiraceae bacterium]
MNHDSFFKLTFQDKENAIDFFKHRLPQELLKDISLDSLEITKDSFVDPNFQDIHSDLLFKVLIANKESYIYLLLEHKSYPDSMTSFQLLKYMVGIWSLYWSQSSKEKNLRLPLILPMVLYHGGEEWQFGNDFLQLQEKMEGWEKYQVNFHYVLFDFSTYKDEEIKGEIVTQLFILLLKYINRDDFEEKLGSIIELLAELMTKTTGMEYIKSVLLYMLSGVKGIELDRIEKMLETEKSGRVKEMLTSLAERLEQKGYERALKLVEVEKQRAERAEIEKQRAEAEKQRAEHKTRLKTAIAMKQKSMDIPLISSITELNQTFLEKFFTKVGI